MKAATAGRAVTLALALCAALGDAAGNTGSALLQGVRVYPDLELDVSTPEQTSDVLGVGRDGEWLALGLVAKPGVVQVYRLTGQQENGGWKLYQTVACPGHDEDQAFGLALDLRGDVLVVGAPTFYSGARGTAYVFRLRQEVSGPTWVFERELPPPPFNGARFGRSVVAGEGYVAVGSPGYGGREVRVFYDDPDSPWQTMDVLEPEPGEDIREFGASLAAVGRTLFVGAPADDDDARGAVAVFSAPPGTQGGWERTATLEHGEPGDEDGFGSSVASDGEVLVVGAPLHGPSAEWVGAAIIYRRDESAPQGWRHDAALTPAGPPGRSFFGRSVAISEGTVVVLDWVPRENGQGALHFYREDPEAAGLWRVAGHYVSELSTVIPRITPTLDTSGDEIWLGNAVHRNFGGPAAVRMRLPFGSSRDVVGSGSSPLFATPGEPLVLSGEHVRFTDLAWEAGGSIQVRLEHAPGRGVLALDGNALGAGDTFSVADLDGGRVTYTPDPGSGGVADAFRLSGTARSDGAPGGVAVEVWVPAVANPPYLEPAEHQIDARYGYSVALDDGIAAVGSTYHDPFDSTGQERVFDGGIVWVYARRDDGTNRWDTVAGLTAPEPEARANFGQAVAVCGRTIAVGSWTANLPDRFDAGLVHLYRATDESRRTWVYSTTLMASDPVADADFGYSVALDGDTLVVGCTDALPDRIGAAYIFERDPADPDRWDETAKLQPADTRLKDEFGYAVAIDGNRIAVSDHLATNGAGSVTVFEKQGGLWTETAELDDRGSFRVRFGNSIALEGDLLAVGETLYSWAYSGSGAVRVYRAAGDGSWRPVQRLYAPPGMAEVGARFGRAVAFAGRDIYVGAYYQDALDGFGRVAEDIGAVYRFRPSGRRADRWVCVRAFRPQPPFPSFYMQFGRSLATDGVSLLAAAHGAKNVETPGGRVYQYSLVQPPPRTPGTDPPFPHAGPDADNDGVGFPLEILYGSDPAIPDASAAEPVTGQGGLLTGLEIPFDPTPFVDLVMEGSDNLGDWRFVPSRIEPAATPGRLRVLSTAPQTPPYLRLRGRLLIE